MNVIDKLISLVKTGSYTISTSKKGQVKVNKTSVATTIYSTGSAGELDGLALGFTSNGEIIWLSVYVDGEEKRIFERGE